MPKSPSDALQQLMQILSDLVLEPYPIRRLSFDGRLLCRFDIIESATKPTLDVS